MSEGATPNAGAPTYADLRRNRSDNPGGKYLSAKNFPNGLDVEVIRVEVQPGFQDKGYSAYWVVHVPDQEGEKLVKESAFMSDKLEDLGIEDPTGRKFLLTATTYKNNATFQIARAL